MKRATIVAMAIVASFAAAGAPAQSPVQSPTRTPAQNDSALDARTTAVAHQLRCPVCQGESIQDSPAQLAKQMRDVVRDQLAAGKTPDEVKAYFVSKYGEWILLEPRVAGFNLLIYVLPWAAVFGGLAVIVVAVRKWTRPVDSTEAADQQSPTLNA